MYIWRVLPPGTVSHYTVIIIIRTALAFSSGNRTQIRINSVCNHRSRRENCFSVVLLWSHTIYRKKDKLNSSISCFSDVNECATEKHNCDNSSKCHNTKGSFLCICREPGYFWNGVNCTGKYNVQWDSSVDSSDKSGRCVIGVYQMVKSCSLLSSLVSRLFPLFRW